MPPVTLLLLLLLFHISPFVSQPTLNPTTSTPTFRPTFYPTPYPTAYPTIEPTFEPIFLRSQYCQVLDFGMVSYCSFVLCPNQESRINIYENNPRKLQEDENEGEGESESEKEEERLQRRLQSDDPINAEVLLYDSKNQEMNISEYEGRFRYDLSFHFCDLMRYSVRCLDSNRCGNVGSTISIFQTANAVTIPKYSFGLIFDPQQYPSYSDEGLATSYYYDYSSGEIN